jgi:hypothetical protein
VSNGGLEEKKGRLKRNSEWKNYIVYLSFGEEIDLVT